MACFHPLSAWMTDEGKVVFVDRGAWRPLQLPCGQCVGCRLERSRQWAVRCMHESAMHDSSAFITLTYSDKDCPPDGSLDYSHFQRFMKRLRFSYGPVRFYMCGEYGERTSRPHFHACIFGLDLQDGVLFSEREGVRLYTSATLSKWWPYGHSSFGEVTFESAAYVARYVMKKVTGAAADDHYSRVDLHTGELFSVTPEFCRMSLKPGIGATWFDKFKSDVYPLDVVHIRGMQTKPPRYYDKKFRETASFPELLNLDAERFARAIAVESDNSPARLLVREEVTKAGLRFKVRNLE